VAGVGVNRIHEGKVTKIGDSREIGASVNAITVAPNGTLYAVSFKGVAAWDGKAWTMTEKAKLGDAKQLYDVVADAKNRVFVATPEKIWMLDGGKWSALDHAKATTRKPIFSKLAVGPDGALHATFMEGLMRWKDGEITVFKPARFWRTHSLAMDAKGRFIAVAYGDLKIFAADGKEEKSLKPAEAGFKAKSVSGMTLDGSGRIWLQTDFGVVILDAELKATQWEPGMFRELAGGVQVIAVVGAGPALPTPGPKIAGDVKGKVLKAGKPVTGADIEICESPATMHRGTPCTEAIYQQAGKTAADGSFELKAVPLGKYRFAIKAGAKWTVTFGGDCCTQLSPDSAYDIGAIQLK
jgi:ligand-binding sensor domain-containing protein